MKIKLPVHPLTCGADDCRAILVPKEKENKVVLICPSCQKVQTWVPSEVISRNNLPA